jgi:hypothetical protein
MLYLQINNQLHLMLLQSRTVTWESLQRIMLVFIVIAKANEETADKTDEATKKK